MHIKLSTIPDGDKDTMTVGLNPPDIRRVTTPPVKKQVVFARSGCLYVDQISYDSYDSYDQIRIGEST